MSVRIAVAGAGGRMGQALIDAVLAAPDLALAGALDLPDSVAQGTDAGARCGRTTGVRVASDVDAVLRGVDVLVDFTRPSGTLAHLAACATAGVAAVVGTTGFDANGKGEIAACARTIPIVFAPNMSVGVNVLADLVERAARLGFDALAITLHDSQFADPRVSSYARERGITLIPGIERTIAAKCEGRSVQAIGAGFQSDVNRRARHPAVFRLGTLDGVDFLDRV